MLRHISAGGFKSLTTRCSHLSSVVASPLLTSGTPNELRVICSVEQRSLYASAHRARAATPIASTATPTADMTDGVQPRADKILRFWLGEGYSQESRSAGPGEDRVALWYRGGPEVDKACAAQFGHDLEAAGKGELDDWRSGYDGLAAVVLMDQLSRNIHRGTASSFALDNKVLKLSKTIHDSNSLSGIPLVQRTWLYLPLMHSENLKDQELCVSRFEDIAAEARGLSDAEALQGMLANNISFAKRHLEVVEKWGRFPHRNAVLGRANTPEEEQGLAAGTIPKF